MEHREKSIGFSTIFTALGYVLATLSIVMLIKHGFEMRDFVAPLQLVLQYYEALIHVFVGWADPYLRSALATLNQFLGWHLKLDPQWRHVFILMMLFFGAVARDFLSRTDEDRVLVASKMAAAISWVIGFTLSVTTSILVSISPTSPVADDLASALLNGLLAAAPLFVIGIFFVGHGIRYWISLGRKRGLTWWRVALQLPAVLLVVGVVVVAAATTALWVAGAVGHFPSEARTLLPLLMLPRPVLILLGLVALALFFISWAALNAGAWTLLRGVTWRQAFLSNSWASIGLSILGVLTGATAFIICNAGLRLLDL